MNHTPHRGSGFVPSKGHTLIELMIAIIIGLILVLAAFQVMATFEGHKRTSTAMNDALQSANLGLFQLDAFARSSGTGMVQAGTFAYGCALNYTPTGGTTVNSGTIALPAPFSTVLSAVAVKLRLAPVLIFPNATTAGSDVLLMMLGGAGYGEVPDPIIQILSGGQMQIQNAVGYKAGDWVLLAGSGAADCMVTKVDPSYNSSATSPNLVMTLTQSSVGSATVATYAHGSIVDLGPASSATFIMYGVGDNDTLYSVDLLNSDVTTAQEFSDDIVTLRAIYGVDTNNDGKLDTWVNPVDTATTTYAPASLLTGTAAGNALLRTIKAIRIAVVVRAPLSERADASHKSLETGNAFNPGSYTLFSSLPATVQSTWTVPVGQEDYRYRELESTIPLRNASY